MLPSLLIIEDDFVDFDMINLSLKSIMKDIDIHRSQDGENAFELLKSNLQTKQYVILLDLNLPKMNGIEFLKKLRSNSSINKTIVIVYSTSEDPIDINTCYEEGISGYITKSSQPSEILEKARAIINFIKQIKTPILFQS